MRHAFLIIAHNNWDLLMRLVKKLDSSNNDIFIHIDKKSDISNEIMDEIRCSCNISKVEFIERYNVNWGGYSQINSTLRLFERARKGAFDYYHILSGIDFPIKPMKEIDKFFEQNKGYEFVHFCTDEFTKANSDRYAQYHWLQEKVGRNQKGILYYLEKVSVKIQKNVFQINRAKKYKDVDFKCGSNWCSLSHEFVNYLLENENKIKKMFSHSCCCDEFYIQTMLYNSRFKNRIYKWNDKNNLDIDNLRAIDWERGNPYTFQEDDYEELVKSNNLFCRKVSDQEQKYEKLIQKLEKL